MFNLSPARARILTVALTAALLTACGFHLRGDLPLDDARLHISGADHAMVTVLTDALTQNNATVTDAIDATTTRIQLHASAFQRATLTTDARGRASSFEIRYTVEFSIKPPGDGDGGDDGAAGDGDNESRPRTVTLRRALDYDPTRQLQSEAESTFLESAMRIEAAAQIMQYLGARLESPLPHSPSIR